MIAQKGIGAGTTMDDRIEHRPGSFWELPVSRDRIFLVDSVESEEFGLFCWAMERTCIVAMDSEWKPSVHRNDAGLPRVALLQIACRIYDCGEEDRSNGNEFSDRFCNPDSESEVDGVVLENHVHDNSEELCSAEGVNVREENVEVGMVRSTNGREHNSSAEGTVNFEIGQRKSGGHCPGQNFFAKRSEWRDKIFGEVGASRGQQNVQELIFLLDLLALPFSSFWVPLKTVFVSLDILKLGFKFRQDLMFLAGSFSGQDKHSCFEKVDPFIDIGKLYSLLQNHDSWLMTRGRKMLIQESKSLAAICEEVLGLRLSKDLQCSDWEQRPLTNEQIVYAAADAHCLLGIFDAFHKKFLDLYQENFGGSGSQITDSSFSTATIGLKELLMTSAQRGHQNILRTNLGLAVEMVKATLKGTISMLPPSATLSSYHLRRKAIPICEPILKIAQTFGERILLSECERKAKSGARKGRLRRSQTGDKRKEERMERYTDWQGPPPWDLSLGGDGDPRFLCDAMVEGLARQLRCVGIDAASPCVKTADPRQLVEQALEEKRVLLTRDIKLLRRHFVPRNSAYRVKNLAKQKQLVEVIDTFNLKISEYQLMSRCIKCNGRFMERPLTTSEAIVAATSEQVIPEFLIDQDFEFWQCSDCRQIYWENVELHASKFRLHRSILVLQPWTTPLCFATMLKLI